MKVIATSSPRNLGLLKSLGADAVFDYNDPTAAEQIRKHANDQLHHVFDCVSEGNSFAFCATALASGSSFENHYSGLLPFGDFPRPEVKARVTIAYKALGEPINLGAGEIPAQRDDLEFARRFWSISQELLGQGKFKVHPVEVRSGGLESVPSGYVCSE